MKLLLFNAFDIYGGAAKASFRFHKALLHNGLTSRMKVQNKRGDLSTVDGPKTKFQKGLALIRPELDKLPLFLYTNRKKDIFSTAWIPWGKKMYQRDTDITHLHWICDGFLGIETLKTFDSPIIWTMHDMWPFTGGCHYDKGCGKFVASCGACPMLGSGKENDLSRWIWKRKLKAWKNINLVLVSPSRWLKDEAVNSSLFQKRRIEYIPNGIDINIFKPIDKLLARKIWNLPPKKILILFGAMNSTSDPRKGFHYLKAALDRLKNITLSHKIELIIFGASERETKTDFGFQTHYIGMLNDDISLALLYSSADIYVAPSQQENLSNMVIEALSCGTPSIAFHIGGMSDMIDHKKNGYLAKPFDINDLFFGIKWLIEDKKRLYKLSCNAREKAVSQFSLDLMVKRYKNLYEDILNKVQ